jgi:hypothetical protein
MKVICKGYKNCSLSYYLKDDNKSYIHYMWCEHSIPHECRCMNGAYPKCNCSVIYLRSEKLKKLENLNN